MHSFFGVFLCMCEVVFGNFYLVEKYDGAGECCDFIDVDEEVVEVLVVAVGVVVENVQLYECIRCCEIWFEVVGVASQRLVLDGAMVVVL